MPFAPSRSFFFLFFFGLWLEVCAPYVSVKVRRKVVGARLEVRASEQVSNFYLLEVVWFGFI